MGYAHTDGVGILPGEESERKTVDNYFSRRDVPRCEQNEVGLPCEVMRHKSGRGKFAISATSVIRGNFIPSGNVCSRAYGSTNDRKKGPVREFAPSDKLPTGKDGAMFRTHIRAGDELQNKQIKAMKCLICKVRVGLMSVKHQ